MFLLYNKLFCHTYGFLEVSPANYILFEQYCTIKTTLYLPAVTATIKKGIDTQNYKYFFCKLDKQGDFKTKRCLLRYKTCFDSSFLCSLEVALLLQKQTTQKIRVLVHFPLSVEFPHGRSDIEARTLFPANEIERFGIIGKLPTGASCTDLFPLSFLFGSKI